MLFSNKCSLLSDNFMLKRYLITLILCFSFLHLTSGQSRKEVEDLYDIPAAQEGDLLCRCISTFIPEKNETFFFKIGEEYHEVALVPEGISIIFPVRKTNVFKLYSKNRSEEGAPIYFPVVEQALEGKGKDYILILSRSQNSSPINSVAYNINIHDYPTNGLYVFNQTGLNLGLRVDDTNAVIEPFGTHIHDFRDVSRDIYTSAKIAIAYNGKPKVMASKRLRLVPGRRFMMFCFPSKKRAEMGATPLRVLTLQDMPKKT